MSEITVQEVPIERILKVHESISEFKVPAEKAHFEERYHDRVHLIILGSLDGSPAGYLVGYDRDGDGSFYCWMAGVEARYRRHGVLSALMDYQEQWAKNHGYNKIKLRTVNARREMLINLVKRGFLFTEVEQRPDAQNNAISLEYPL